MQADGHFLQQAVYLSCRNIVIHSPATSVAEGIESYRVVEERLWRDSNQRI